MVIRLGTAADLEAAWQVWHDSIVARDELPVSEEIGSIVRERLAEPDAWLVVAEENGVIVGMASAGPAREGPDRSRVLPHRCHVGMVFVAPSHWGAGIGGGLLDLALDEAGRRGCTGGQLWVVEGNERATRLYARRGFTRTGTTETGDRGEPIGLWAREL